MEVVAGEMPDKARGKKPENATKPDTGATGKENAPAEPLFDNPFNIDDLQVFDRAALREITRRNAFGFDIKDLALSLRDTGPALRSHIEANLTARQRLALRRHLGRPARPEEVETARRKVLDGLFWELTYWKTPELYEELTAGEQIHPGIFERLGPKMRGKTVLDAGAGSGRASFECMRQGARLVYAVEPSPGLLRLLEQKLASQPGERAIKPLRGRFDSLPLDENSVDISISCSAFTADPEQGGEPGLKELLRVTRPGGQVVIIWPRPEDRGWLEERGFRYTALPVRAEMQVRYRSLRSALRVARRFYARNRALLRYLRERKRPEVPFSVLGFNPPRDYCWLKVEK